MRLINKSSYKVIDYTGTVSSNDYATISDALVEQLDSLKYCISDDGTEAVEDEVYLCHTCLDLIQSVTYEEVEGSAFDRVLTMTFNDRDTKILEYKGNKILEENDAYFKFCKYKITGNIPEFFIKYSEVVISCLFNPKIQVDAANAAITSEDHLQVPIYLSTVSDTMMALILVEPDLVSLEENMYYDASKDTIGIT